MRTNKFDGAMGLAAGAMLLAALLAGCAKRPLAAEAAPPAAPNPLARTEPAVESMRAATPSAKMSVAADLRYSFDGEVLANQPAMLHLAAIPRGPGTTLRISVQQADGLQIAPGEVRVQKASTSDIYRQDVAVTKLTGAPAQMRVLVTMESAAGSGFGYFSIPLGSTSLGSAPVDGGTTAQKQESVKQR